MQLYKKFSNPMPKPCSYTYLDIVETSFQAAKKCARIAVAEILSAVMGRATVCNSPTCKYWAQVKEEVDKIEVMTNNPKANGSEHI